MSWEFSSEAGLGLAMRPHGFKWEKLKALFNLPLPHPLPQPGGSSSCGDNEPLHVLQDPRRTAFPSPQQSLISAGK